jgi:radical SAM protein with 4Fe4S-binding SPASM domain
MAKLYKIGINAYLQKRYPISLVHFVTNRCNARCKHCFIDFDSPNAFKNELSIDEIAKLTKTYGKSLLNVNITGGEPFLRPDLFEIVKLYFENAAVNSVYITSHGGFPDRIRKFVDKFKASKIKGQIIISLSIDNFPEEHNLNRKVRGLFDKTMETYKMLSQYEKDNIIPNIAITVTHHNFHRALEIYEFLKSEHKVTSFSAIAMREQGVVEPIDANIKKSIYEAYSALTKKISEDMRSRQTTGYKGSFISRMLNAKNSLVYDILKDTYLDPHYVSDCPSAAMFGVIYANGDVYPCEVLDEKKLGNLHDFNMNFMDLWSSSDTSSCRKFILDTKCNCTYECALGINIITNAKHIPSLLSGLTKQSISNGK